MYHSFDTEAARAYGVNAAIILNHLVFWIKKNAANKKNFHDGKYWTHNSQKAMQELFPYLTLKQIRTAIDRLYAAGEIEKGNYNDTPTDQTTWYAVSEKWLVDVPLRAAPTAPEGNTHIYINTNNNINTDIDHTDINNIYSKEYMTDSLRSVNSARPSSSLSDVVSAWNSLSEVGVPGISKLSPGTQRYKWTSSRLKQYGLPTVLQAIENVRHSPFLLSGKFNFTYDWFIRPNNFIKVLDGNYLEQGYKPAEVKEPRDVIQEEWSEEKWLASLEGD